MTDKEKILKNALKQFWLAQKVLDEEGHFLTDKWGVHRLHPAVTLQKQSFAIIYKLMDKSEAGEEKSLEDLLSSHHD